MDYAGGRRIPQDRRDRLIQELEVCLTISLGSLMTDEKDYLLDAAALGAPAYPLRAIGWA
jgi:hypothetical protein